MKRHLFCCLFAAVLISSPLFAGETDLKGYNIHFLNPSAETVGFVNLRSSRTLPPMTPAFSFTASMAKNLLKATNTATGAKVNLVDQLGVADVSAALGLIQGVDLGLNIPVALYEKGASFNTGTSFVSAGIGDLRIDAKGGWPLSAEEPLGIGITVSAWIPTGGRTLFLGSPAPVGEVRVILDKETGPWLVGLNGGVRVRKALNVAGIAVDDETHFGAGAAYNLDVKGRRATLFVEGFGSTLLKEQKEITTPVEFIGGLVAELKKNWALKVGGGAGATSGIGSPSYRFFSGLSYVFGPRVPEAREWIPVLVRVVFTFGFDKAELSIQERARLEDWMARFRGQGLAAVVIHAHTDSVGDERYNFGLARRRGESTRTLLVRQGIREDIIAIVVYGEVEPAQSNATAAGRAANRRAEITVVY